MKYLVLVVFLLLPAALLPAVPVKGIVKDLATGEELTGATIVWKEEPAKGTITGLDGSFRLDVPLAKGVLICSYLGYQTVELPVEESRPDLLVLLQPLYREIEEVVVYAHTGNTETGVRNMEKLSPSIMNIVSAKAIEISPDITVANVIGRVSGVTLERNSFSLRNF